MNEYTGKIIGIVSRENDVEDKLIMATEGVVFTQNEIAERIHFQEQYYKIKIESLFEKSCGAVIYTVLEDKIEYLLIKSQNGDIGFPKDILNRAKMKKLLLCVRYMRKLQLELNLYVALKKSLSTICLMVKIIRLYIS